MTVRLTCGSEMLHVPKTGGTWVTSVLEANGLVAEHVGHKHADFDCNLFGYTYTGRQHLAEALRSARKKIFRTFRRSAVSDPPPPFRFCFVRHPLSWYESWWKYMKGRGWDDWGVQNSAASWHPNSVLNGLGSEDFNEFVWNVIRVRPGYVSELYFSYTKPGIQFIGKTETLREDLGYVLDQLGHNYSRETVFTSPQENISKTSATEICWDPELRLLVTQLELSALVHFDYLTDSEKRILGIKNDILPNKAVRRRPQLSGN